MVALVKELPHTQQQATAGSRNDGQHEGAANTLQNAENFVFRGIL